MGISTVIIGATVVSLGTTAPEVAVSVTAAFQGKPDVALGNGVGSIICDTGLIFGLLLVMTRLPLDRFILHRQGVLKIAAGLLLAAVVAVPAMLSGSIEGIVVSRTAGLVFAGLLVGYMFLSVRWSRAHPQSIPDEAKVAPARAHQARKALWNFVLLTVGLAMVVIGSRIMIGSVDQLARRHGVPEDVLAVTVVAFGTSLPELVTAVASVIKGHGELAIGNVIGADILNVLAVIGFSAAASPSGLNVAPAFLYLHLPVMMLALGVMGAYIFTSGKTFRRWQGAPLLAIYAAYLLILFLRFGSQGT